MMEGGRRLTQPWGKTAYTSFCLFHVKANCCLPSFLMGFKTNAFICSIAADHVLSLCYPVLAKILHLTEELHLGFLLD